MFFLKLEELKKGQRTALLNVADKKEIPIDELLNELNAIMHKEKIPIFPALSKLKEIYQKRIITENKTILGVICKQKTRADHLEEIELCKADGVIAYLIFSELPEELVGIDFGEGIEITNLQELEDIETGAITYKPTKDTTYTIREEFVLAPILELSHIDDLETGKQLTSIAHLELSFYNATAVDRSEFFSYIKENGNPEGYPGEMKPIIDQNNKMNLQVQASFMGRRFYLSVAWTSILSAYIDDFDYLKELSVEDQLLDIKQAIPQEVIAIVFVRKDPVKKKDADGGEYTVDMENMIPRLFLPYFHQETGQTTLDKAMPKVDKAMLSKRNRDAVYTVVKSKDTISMAEIQQGVKFPKEVVEKLVEKLLEVGIVYKAGVDLYGAVIDQGKVE